MTSTFGTILADPPWPYKSPRAIVGNGGRGSQDGAAAKIIQADVLQHYNVMTMEQIKNLPISKLAQDNAHLYLWTTNSFMVEAHEVARAWGFQPKTIITWVKTQKAICGPSMKTGHWYRSATEHVIFAVRGKQRLNGPAAPTVFFGNRLPHSVKPDEFYDMIEAQSPGPYLELFARRPRQGWDSWGNQINSTISMLDPIPPTDASTVLEVVTCMAFAQTLFAQTPCKSFDDWYKEMGGIN